MVYRRRPDVNAIVRTEPVYSNVFGVLGRPIETVLVNMVIYSRGPVPVMPFMPGNSTEFGETMVKVLGTPQRSHLGQPRLDDRRRGPYQRLQMQRGRGDRSPGPARRAVPRPAPCSQLSCPPRPDQPERLTPTPLHAHTGEGAATGPTQDFIRPNGPGSRPA